MYKNEAVRVLTGEVRLSFVHLDKPVASKNGGEAKYSTTILIPKSDTTCKTDIDQSIQAAIEYGRQTTWGGVTPPTIRIPLYDGEGVRPSGEAFGEE